MGRKAQNTSIGRSGEMGILNGSVVGLVHHITWTKRHADGTGECEYDVNNKWGIM